MYDQILIPTDGSDGTKTAVKQAITHAQTYDAELHVLHVIDQSAVEITAPPTIEGISADVVHEQLDEQGQSLINEVTEEANKSGVSTTTEIVEYGRPHEEIQSYAAEQDIDLIVIGTHGRSGLNRQLLGSVAEKVIRTAEVPILAVQLDE
ncbi:universal stress protein [Haladaptatus pallidirubidus]|uniref:Universal stress protein n=1 Tax=Haladaptatus pallidirubidus TaxID=1008152 RepID=A0AAV3UNS7_9EURY|nr:universal stress protein [Haladaptatus pallidirubidus]